MAIRAMVVAITMAQADPAIPSAGAGPRPRISTGLSATSSTVARIMNRSGVAASPDPRSPIAIIVVIVVTGLAMNTTCR